MITETNLRQKRGLGKTISDSFNYLRYHFTSLYKIVLLVSGPILLLGGIIMGMTYSNLFRNMDYYATAPPSMGGFGLGFFMSMLFLSIGSMALYSLIVEYMKVSLTKSKEDITFNDVLNGFKKRFWKYLVATIIIAIILFVSVFFLIIPMIWLGVIFSIIFFVIGIEDEDPFESLGRCFRLMKGYWWRSFGLYFLMGIIQVGLTYALILPIYVVLGVLAFSTKDPGAVTQKMPMVMIFLMPTIIIISSLSYSLSGIASGVNYFSIVEAKEEIGLKERIESIDTEG